MAGEGEALATSRKSSAVAAAAGEEAEVAGEIRSRCSLTFSQRCSLALFSLSLALFIGDVDAVVLPSTQLILYKVNVERRKLEHSVDIISPISNIYFISFVYQVLCHCLYQSFDS